MLDKEKLQEIVASAASELAIDGDSTHDSANTIRTCSRIALGLDPQVDISELPSSVALDLIDVMRGVRNAVLSSIEK